MKIENNFPAQFPVKQCICGKTENKRHIFSCRNNDKNIEDIPYKRIFEENVKSLKQIYLIFKNNIENEENKLINVPLDPSVVG